MKTRGAAAVVAAIMVLALSSFQSQTETKKQPLVVERQQCVLQHMVVTIPSEDFDIGITMDIPVDGDPVLVDSVMRLLNQALYFFFDDDSRFLEDMQYRISAGYDAGGRNYFGLKKDKVWNEYLYAPGIIDTTWYDMKVIKPYLFEEAKELLK